MFERQILHYVLLALLLGAVTAVCSFNPNALSGQWAGLSTTAWLVLAIAIPIVHQFYVWLVWRVELHYGLVSKWFGRERGFSIYAVGFAVLFGARALALIALAISNYGTLGIAPWLAYTLAVVLGVPWVYAIVSVLRYFGLRRAFGIDHFDPAYRDMPFVREGIFRFTSNGMYGPGFLIVWLPGLIGLSAAALIAGIFNHVYIWVHYYATELPDIRGIYSGKAN